MLATCLGCGCACDDIQLRIERNRIVEAAHACALGVEWFGDGGAPSRALAGGRDCSVDEALTRAAAVLGNAARPLVYLAPDISCEAQRAAIAIADALRATIDSVTSATVMTTLLAAQEIGRASATLGELKNRADVVVFWGVDPAQRYPRFGTRYAPDAQGLHVGGRRDRKVIAVDVGSARGPEDADIRLTVMPDREVATLTELTAAVAGLDDQRGLSDDRGADPVGSAKASLTRLAPRSDERTPALQTMLSGKYVAVIADAEPDDQQGVRDGGRSAALTAFVQVLNGPTRSALVTLRAGGNRSGADGCLTAQTGYPMAVDFASGYPRYRPHEAAAARLARGRVDAVLLVGAAALLPPGLAAAMSQVPAVAIGSRASESAFANAAAVVDTAIAGIHESGTALRMDDVPLPLDRAIDGPPATAETVVSLAARLQRRLPGLPG
jgi:formylmethanofuran dehydrogenase subunit B